mmetsp:Transcript_133065/g.384913  ORF Transcript_133065/g.384913 Transcript_133065/m.384913 type:complete len:433 (+) Transcript_133065:139-1437(+)
MWSAAIGGRLGDALFGTCCRPVPDGSEFWVVDGLRDGRGAPDQVSGSPVLLGSAPIGKPTLPARGLAKVQSTTTVSALGDASTTCETTTVAGWSTMRHEGTDTESDGSAGSSVGRCILGEIVAEGGRGSGGDAGVGTWRRGGRALKTWARRWLTRRRSHTARNLVTRLARRLRRRFSRSSRRAAKPTSRSRRLRRRLRRALARQGREASARTSASSGGPRALVRTPSLRKDCEELPSAMELPLHEAPVVDKFIAGATVGRIRTALLQGGQGHGPLARYLKDEMGCQEVDATAWVQASAKDGVMKAHSMQRIRYRAPLPKDLPAAVSRALSLPDLATTTTLNRLEVQPGGGHLVLTQTSRAQGVQFSDRFRIEHVHSFQQDGERGVRWRQWTTFVWTHPLPWTQSFLRSAIESRAHKAAKDGAASFEARILRA